jgi:hypothetical protein
MQLSRFVLPAALAMGSAVAMLTPAVAQAGEGSHHEVHYRHRRHEHDFRIYYRRDACQPWRYYGCFDDRPDARCAAERLEHRGFLVSICR